MLGRCNCGTLLAHFCWRWHGLKESLNGDVAQLGERLPCTQEVVGSSPIVSTCFTAPVRGVTETVGFLAPVLEREFS